MKKRKFLIVFLLSILLLPMFIIITLGSGKVRSQESDDELENIENLIIIKGIEYPDPIGNNSGKIIYQDFFDDTVKKSDSEKNRHTLQVKPASKKNNEIFRKDFIDQLKKKDKSWHFSLHKIKKGENLWSIADSYKTDYKIIIKANSINDPDLLHAGNILQVPNRKGINYRVKKNDTLTGIAKTYGIDSELIAAQNNLKKNLIFQDALIFIPNAEEKVSVKNEQAENLSDNNAENSSHEKSEIKTDRIAKREFLWPVNGDITSAFGERVDPITNKKKFHCGLDIKVNLGSIVKASADGKVIFSGWKKGYGRVVILKHDDGYITVYAHNKENIVNEGSIVRKGDTVALSGMSGAVTGAHLHFEIRKYLTPLNPLRFLR